MFMKEKSAEVLHTKILWDDTIKTIQRSLNIPLVLLAAFPTSSLEISKRQIL